MKYVVTSDDAGSRVDKIVKKLCKNVGYVFLQKQFRIGAIKVNGKKVKADFKVSEGDEIFSRLEESTESKYQENPKLLAQLKSMIIFENDDFFAINKPAGLAVQLGSKVNFCVETLINSYSDKCHLVHRLDKDTSGVLLIAKNLKTAQQLAKWFSDGMISKTYVAIVDGKIKKAGVVENFIGKSFVGGVEKMTAVEESKGVKAISSYKPIKRVGYYTLLELSPKTGRKHQLRVHCKENLKAPILGDSRYNENSQHEHLFLHAQKIKIQKWNIEIEAPLPEYFHQFDETN